MNDYELEEARASKDVTSTGMWRVKRGTLPTNQGASQGATIKSEGGQELMRCCETRPIRMHRTESRSDVAKAMILHISPLAIMHALYSVRT